MPDRHHTMNVESDTVKLSEILNTFQSRKNTPIFAEVMFANGKHYIVVKKASLVEVLKREFGPDEETGKHVYYNDPHDSFFLEDIPVPVTEEETPTEERKAA